MLEPEATTQILPAPLYACTYQIKLTWYLTGSMIYLVFACQPIWSDNILGLPHTSEQFGPLMHPCHST